jgi:calcium/calmodulin-dependent protein kinase I
MSSHAFTTYRDLKPENLLYADETEHSPLKLADFGLAKLLDASSLMHTACGTPGYVAPEILENRPYGQEVDLWSLGVITYILLCGFPPFYDENNAALFRSIKSGRYEYPSPFWDDVSEAARHLIDHLLVLGPAKRYTAENVLLHPWVTEEDTGHARRPLPHFRKSMILYNSRRKFRAGILTLQALQLMRSMRPSEGVADLPQRDRTNSEPGTSPPEPESLVEVPNENEGHNQESKESALADSTYHALT